MSAYYELVIPDGKKEITLGLPYGSVTMKNGQIVPRSSYTETFRELFKEIPDAVTEKVTVTAEAIADEKMETPEVKMETPAKRKAGRPKKIFKK
jgi:hypothetical protein